MVSFSCEVCNDTIVKKKLAQHQRSCRGSYFTCIDCSKTFYNNEHNAHTSCISEAEKYEGALYKGNGKKKGQNDNNNNKQQQKKKEEPKPEPKPEVEKEEPKKESKKKTTKSEIDISKYTSTNKSESLYKIIKKITKDSKKDKSEILKLLQITQNDDGSYKISL